MAKRKRYPAWEVSWEEALWATSASGEGPRWLKGRDVFPTKAEAMEWVGELRPANENVRNIRIRPLDYADKDEA